MDDTISPPFSDAEYHAYVTGLGGLLVWWFLPWFAMCGALAAVAAPPIGLPMFAILAATTTIAGLVTSGVAITRTVPVGVRGILADDPPRFVRSILLLGLGLLNAAVVVGFAVVAFATFVALGLR